MHGKGVYGEVALDAVFVEYSLMPHDPCVVDEHVQLVVSRHKRVAKLHHVTRDRQVHMMKVHLLKKVN